MQELLVYYGWLNSFCSSINSWDNDNVISDISGKYDTCVLGDGIQDPDHGDYSNSEYIISGLKSANVKVYGYVTANQTLSEFQAKANQWGTLEVDGIFFDEAGYDFGVSRSDLNSRIDFVREMNYSVNCFVNSWNIEHILGTENDSNFPNSTYNSGSVESNLESTDHYLLENLTIVNSSYEGLEQWMKRIKAAKKKVVSYPINLNSVSIIDDADADGQKKFDDLYAAAKLLGLYATGSSSLTYGASGAAVNFWTRPDVSYL